MSLTASDLPWSSEIQVPRGFHISRHTLGALRHFGGDMSKWWEEEVVALWTLQSLKVEWAGVPRLIRALDFFRAWLGSTSAKPLSYCLTTILTSSSPIETILVNNLILVSENPVCSAICVTLS